MLISEFTAPDYSFSPVLLDKTSKDCPLPSPGVSAGYNLPGVYAWTDGETGEILYIGKALKLKNRLQRHWYGATDMVEHMLDAGIIPQVHVWLCNAEDRAGLERTMLDKAHPRYNVRLD